jgi:hypothetical protein
VRESVRALSGRGFGVSSEDDAVGTAVPAVLRQRDLIRALGVDVVGLLGELEGHVVVECRLLAGYGEYATRVVRVDGSAESVRTPPSVKEAARKLRERVMYSAAGGTWLSARFVVGHGGGVGSEFNYDTEPDWSHELDPQLYAQELRAFPRDESAVPEWLRLKASSASPLPVPVQQGRSPSTGRLVLTDTQWMSIVDGTREGGLVRCCVKVESLREDLIVVAGEGGVFDEGTASRLGLTLGWVVGEEHDYQVPPVVDLIVAQLTAQGFGSHLPTMTGRHDS